MVVSLYAGGQLALILGVYPLYAWYQLPGTYHMYIALAVVSCLPSDNACSMRRLTLTSIAHERLQKEAEEEISGKRAGQVHELYVLLL